MFVVGNTYMMICMAICTVTSYIALKHFIMLLPKLWKAYIAQNSDACMNCSYSQVLTKSSDMLNKDTQGVKKVRG